MRKPIFPSLLAVMFLSACTAPVEERESHAGSTEVAHSPLYDTIAMLDSAMFVAFNAHDARQLSTWFTPDLEFYHDKDGLTGFDTTMVHFRGLFERNRESGLRRERVPGSLEVYPLGDFGALEVCAHRFCHTENGKEDCGTFKNVMVWARDSSGWHVRRVISYDH